MTREELDTLWFQAMRQSIEDGEDCIRYHFAALVAEWSAKQEREACAKVCEDAISPYVTDSGGMKLVTLALAAAIRKRGEVKP